MRAYPDIRFVPVDYRGVNKHLRHFLGQMENVTRASTICSSTFMGGDSLILWRNNIARWFLEKCEEEYLCCFDDDAIPIDDTLKMLDSPADVVGCQFFAKTGHIGHGVDGAFSMAAYKVSRVALGKMAKPYYRFVYTADHTRMTMCECLWFCQQARAAGFLPIHAGAVGHRMSVGVIPPESVQDDCRMAMLQKIPMVTVADSPLSPSA